MRNKLINKIFSVEEQADSLVVKAQEQGRTLLFKAQQEGDEKFNEAIAKARSEREEIVRKAQQESEDKIKQFALSLETKESADKKLKECAEKIANQMVDYLCTTHLKEGR
jgi:vacuolar-type H+-ATPase subunit H